MSAGKICVRSVHTALAGETLRDAARRMAEHGVGTLVVLDAERKPAGILTDRDIVVACVARDRDPGSTRVGDVMTRAVASVRESTPIEEALSAMARAHARRLAVTDDQGRLAGLLALDDVLDLLAEEAETIGRILARR
jgi:CBS domain-containing protein